MLKCDEEVILKGRMVGSVLSLHPSNGYKVLSFCPSDLMDQSNDLQSYWYSILNRTLQLTGTITITTRQIDTMIIGQKSRTLHTPECSLR